MPSFGRPGGKGLFSSLRCNRVPSSNRVGEVRAPASGISWVLGLVPMAVPAPQEVNVSQLAGGKVSVAERRPYREDSLRPRSRERLVVLLNLIIPVIIPRICPHG